MSRFCRVGLLVTLVMGVVGGTAKAQTPKAPGTSLSSVQVSLQRVNGTSVSPTELAGPQGTVFLFWSTQCPWVDRYETRVQSLVSEYQEEGIRFVLVNSNADESLDAIRRQAEEEGEDATYVRDPKSEFARALGATRTPHAFVFDSNQTLVYVGAIDDSPGSEGRAQETYVRSALEAMKAGADLSTNQQKAFGCRIQYP